MSVYHQKMIFRIDLRNNPKALFVFGDNLDRRGLGGQAKAMRGEPNAVGIPTKISPSHAENAHFTDEDFDKALLPIDEAFDRLTEHVKSGGIIIWPADGIGTGLAGLPQRAPKIHNYILVRLSKLESVQ